MMNNNSMGIEEEIQREYIKMKNDNVVDEAITLNVKKKFADSLVKGNTGNELKNCNLYYLQSKPLKIPFKIKFNRFITKLKNILWD